MATYNIRGQASGTTTPGFTIVNFYNSSSMPISNYDSFITDKGTVTTVDSSGTKLTYKPGRALNQITEFISGQTYYIISFNAFTITTDQDEPLQGYLQATMIQPSFVYYYKLPDYCQPIPISTFNTQLGTSGYVSKIVTQPSGQTALTRGYMVSRFNSNTAAFLNFEPGAEYEIKSESSFSLVNNCSNTPTPTPTQTPTPTNTPTNTITPTNNPPSSTPTPTQTGTPTNTPTCSRTPTPTITPTNTITPTRTPNVTPSLTPTKTPPVTPTRTPTKTPPVTPTRTPTRTPAPTLTRTATVTPTRTPLPTATPSVTPTLPAGSRFVNDASTNTFAIDGFTTTVESIDTYAKELRLINDSSTNTFSIQGFTATQSSSGSYPLT